MTTSNPLTAVEALTSSIRKAIHDYHYPANMQVLMHGLETPDLADHIAQAIKDNLAIKFGPVDEVGRAVERLGDVAGFLETQPQGGATFSASVSAEHATDLHLILSHVSRLEGENARLDNVASHWVNEVHNTKRDLKLAVEALEKATDQIAHQHEQRARFTLEQALLAINSGQFNAK